jgi:hypothetical protein
MRKSYFCIIAASLLILAFMTACGQTGTNNPTGITGGPSEIAGNSNGLVGTWYYVNEDPYNDRYESYLTFDPNGNFEIEDYYYYWSDYSEAWVLDDYYQWEGIYEVDGNLLIMEFDDFNDEITFTFVIDGDELTLNFDGDSVTFVRYYGSSSNNKVTNSDPDIPVIETNFKIPLSKGLAGILKQN